MRDVLGLALFKDGWPPRDALTFGAPQPERGEHTGTLDKRVMFELMPTLAEQVAPSYEFPAYEYIRAAYRVYIARVRKTDTPLQAATPYGTLVFSRNGYRLDKRK